MKNKPVYVGIWAAFILFASENKQILDQYKEETGQELLNSWGGTERPNEEETKKIKDNMRLFIRWVTENHWGTEYAPEEYYEIIGELKK